LVEMFKYDENESKDIIFEDIQDFLSALGFTWVSKIYTVVVVSSEAFF
jgi:hypothetical protein